MLSAVRRPVVISVRGAVRQKLTFPPLRLGGSSLFWISRGQPSGADRCFMMRGPGAGERFRLPADTALSRRHCTIMAGYCILRLLRNTCCEWMTN